VQRESAPVDGRKRKKEREKRHQKGKKKEGTSGIEKDMQVRIDRSSGKRSAKGKEVAPKGKN